MKTKKDKRLLADLEKAKAILEESGEKTFVHMAALTGMTYTRFCFVYYQILEGA